MRPLVSMFITALIIYSCAPEKKGTVIARVGTAELTLEDARPHIDSSRGAIDFQLHEYASLWINDELIYQAASQRGIDRMPEFRQQIAEVGRQLANQRYLEDIIYADAYAIRDEVIVDYYKNHHDEFLVREDMIKLNIMACSSREQASAFAASVVQIGNWSLAVKFFRPDSGVPAGTADELPQQYYSQHTLFPPELWKVAGALGMNEVSFPIKAAGKYFVLQPVSFIQQGKPADYELVHDEVRQRVEIERRRLLYENLLGTLRKRYAVELLIGSGTHPDSSQYHE